MKNTKILYWIFTGLFAAFMLFSAIPDLLVTDEAIKFITGLGYPLYIVAFLGAAKILGVIGLLIPGFPRVREWAYAGLFIDLTGATYSVVSAQGFQMPMLFMLVPFTLGALSYIYYHRLYQPTIVQPTIEKTLASAYN